MELLEEDRVGLTEHVEAHLVELAEAADRQTRPGERVTVQHVIGHPEQPADLADLVLEQLTQRLDETISRRQELATAYLRRLAANPDIVLPTVPEGAGVSWANFVVRLSTRFTADDRDAIIGVLHRQDVGAANYYPATPLLPQVRAIVGTEPGLCPVAESAAARAIALPFFNTMTEEQVDIVCDVLEVALSRTGGAARG